MTDGTATDATAPEASGGNGDAAATPPASDQPQAGASSSTASGDGQESSDARIARLEAELAETRREAARRRTEARDATQRAQQLEEAGMTEAQRATRRAEEAEARVQELEAAAKATAVRDRVIAEATKLGAIAPLDLYAIVRDDASVDDADVPAIVKAALDQRPHLVRQAASSGSAGNGARSSEAAGQSDAERLGALWGRPTSIFDARASQAKGGGVIIPDASRVLPSG